MKIRICIIGVILTLFVSTGNTYAQSGMLQDGYTEEGVYYQVFELEKNISICIAGKEITVSRSYIFEKIFTPPRTIKYIQGDYAGILNLQAYYYQDGKTFACYSGTLTLQQ